MVFIFCEAVGSGILSAQSSLPLWPGCLVEMGNGRSTARGENRAEGGEGRLGDQAVAGQVAVDRGSGPVVTDPPPPPPYVRGGYNGFTDGRQDELLRAVDGLPDPKDDVESFVAGLKALIALYEPSAWEIAVIMKRRLGLGWLDLGAGFNERLVYTEWAYTSQNEDMFKRLRERWAKRGWEEVRNCIQGADESFDDFFHRLELCVRVHSGLTDRWAYLTTLRLTLMYHVRPSLAARVKSTCIEWRDVEIEQLLFHYSQAERWLEAVRSPEPKDNMASGSGRAQRKAPRQITYNNGPRLCHFCQQPGHFLRDSEAMKRASEQEVGNQREDSQRQRGSSRRQN